MLRVGTSRPRPRAVWAAFVTATVICLIVVVTVLLPVLGLIGAADASTVGALDVPVGAIAVSIIVSYVVALLLLVATVISRRGALSWITAVGAVIATIIGSIWPLVATATASVGQAQDIVPFIHELIGTVTGG